MQAILAAAADRPVRISWARVREMVTQQDGVPRMISITPASALSAQTQTQPESARTN